MATTSSTSPRPTILVALFGLLAYFLPAEAAPADDPGALKGTWTAAGNLMTPSYACVAALLPGGEVVVAGRAGNSELTNSVLYEASSGRWMLTQPLQERRVGHALTLLPSGKLLTTGGHNSKEGLLSSAELFDPASRTWKRTGAMNCVHYHHAATVLSNGAVLVTGNCYGTNDSWTSVRDEPENDRITRIVARPAIVPFTGTNDYASAEIYDSIQGVWRCVASLKQPRGHHTATLLTNGWVLVVGGVDLRGLALSSAELFDPISESWTSAGELQVARGNHTATLLISGKVLVVGGQDSEGRPYGEAELFDPATRQWTPAGSLLFARSFHAANLLQNGRVLITGGTGFGGSLKFVEVYDPASGTWSRATPMSTARAWHIATLLPNGKVLVAGGVGTGWDDPLSTAELFDPSARDQ